jgi:FkbM family methyltransferase
MMKVLEYIKKVVKAFAPYGIIYLYNSNNSRKKDQYYFESLYFNALARMNIGGGGDYNSSGEKWVIESITEKYKDRGYITVFDVGANKGHYSELLNKIMGNKAKIYTFEPSKNTFDVMEKNIKGMGNIKCYNFGFSDKNTTLTLYSNRNGSGLASVYKRNLEHFGIDMNIEEKVEMRTIDSFCEENNIQKIDFLKLDVEGNELKVLEGAKKIMESGNIEHIQFEFGGCNIDSRTYFQDFYYLLNGQYNIYRIIKEGLFHIDKYKETYECFITTNFLAIKRGI